MEDSNRDLDGIVTILERIEGKVLGPDAVRKIEALIAAMLACNGDDDNGLAIAVVTAAFEVLARSRDGHVVEIRSVIASLNPERRAFPAADWRRGQVVSLEPKSPTSAQSVRFIVADVPGAFLSGGDIVVERSGDKLLVDLPPLTGPAEPGALARLWPSVAAPAVPLSEPERRLLRDRLGSVPWVPVDNKLHESFLPVALAPLLPSVPGLEVGAMHRSTLPVPAAPLDPDSARRRPVRFSLDWPYEDTPTLEKNPVLVRRLPSDGALSEHEESSNSEGSVAVKLPPQDFGQPPVRRVVSVAVRWSDTIDAWLPCRRKGGENESAPTWSCDPLEDRVVIENLSPNRSYLIKIVSTEPGAGQTMRETSWGNDAVSISLLDRPRAVEPHGSPDHIRR